MPIHPLFLVRTVSALRKERKQLPVSSLFIHAVNAVRSPPNMHSRVRRRLLPDGTHQCCMAATNKMKETSKTLLWHSTHRGRIFFIIDTMAIVLWFPAKSLVGLVTSNFASITVLCVLPKAKGGLIIWQKDGQMGTFASAAGGR